MVVHVLDESLDVLESLIELINLRFAHLVLHEQVVGTLTNVMKFINVELDLRQLVNATTIINTLSIVYALSVVHEFITQGVMTFRCTRPIDYILRYERTS